MKLRDAQSIRADRQYANLRAQVRAAEQTRAVVLQALNKEALLKSRWVHKQIFAPFPLCSLAGNQASLLKTSFLPRSEEAKEQRNRHTRQLAPTQNPVVPIKRTHSMEKTPAKKTPAKKTPVTLETVRQILLALPDVEEGTSWGTLAWRLRKKLLARIHEDSITLVIKCADRDPLIASDPQVFFVTKHYEPYPYVLVNLQKVKLDALRELLTDLWRSEASAKQLKLYDSGAYQAPLIAPLANPPKPKADDASYLKRVRAICLALPETEEKEAWGSPTFRLKKGKMFAMYVNNHHGDGEIALWLNAPAGIQSLLVEAAPDKFFIPPYQGVFGWIGVRLDQTKDDEIANHVREAYRMVAPKKLLAQL
jgi:hypothetical protein